MRISLAAGAALMLAAGAATAAELTIPAGQTYIVQPAQSELRLDRLEIGDNATIRFAPTVRRWRVEAAKVVIGHNVTIDGRGPAGAAGASGSDARGKAKDCMAGTPGGAGEAGAPGGNGVELLLRWGVESLGHVQLLTDGGAGGNGGNGGAGQDGGDFANCSAPPAGDGGPGGQGGNGGAGGNVTLTYFDAGGGQDLFAMRDRIQVSAKGGAGGRGGDGGKGGAGAEGRFELTSTPMGRRWLAGGRPGVTGAAGAGGIAGTPGEVRIQEALAAVKPAAVVPAPAPGARQSDDQVMTELRELRRRLQLLEQKVEALERR